MSNRQIHKGKTFDGIRDYVYYMNVRLKSIYLYSLTLAHLDLSGKFPFIVTKRTDGDVNLNDIHHVYNSLKRVKT